MSLKFSIILAVVLTVIYGSSDGKLVIAFPHTCTTLTYWFRIYKALDMPLRPTMGEKQGQK